MSYRWNNNFRSYKKFETRSELEKIEFQINKLQREFGSNFDEPKPEDFSLDVFLIDFIEKYNSDTRKYNDDLDKIRNTFSIGLVIILYAIGVSLVLLSQKVTLEFVFQIIFGALFSGIFLIPFAVFLLNQLIEKIVPSKKKKEHELSGKYYSYLEKKQSYPGTVEINKLLEKLKFLREQKMKKEYWFSLTGHEFEEEMTRLFKKFNYKSVLKTRGSGDGGVDIIITKHDESKIFVQCKAHKKPAGPHTVRDLFGAMKSGGVEHGLLISLAGVSVGATDFIRDKKIDVLDADGIININMGKNIQQNSLNLF